MCSRDTTADSFDGSATIALPLLMLNQSLGFLVLCVSSNSSGSRNMAPGIHFSNLTDLIAG